jgi:hypothetical protein
MDFITKNGLYIKLQSGAHSEADSALLKEKNPKSKALNTRYFDKNREKKEILWDLIEHASEDEILDNRKKYSEKSEKIPAKEEPEEREKEKELSDEELTKKELVAKYGKNLDISLRDSKKKILQKIEDSKKKQ